MAIRNDEPIYAEDQLNHRQLVKTLGDMIIRCDPPYVIGVCGSWGAGKTSFMRKLWAYLGGKFDAEGNDERKRDQSRKAQCLSWYGADWSETQSAVQDWHLIWFNPWHHQFETSPLVALLQEIQQHFSMTKQMFNEAGKLANVATYSALNMLTEIGKAVHLPMPNAKETMEYGARYEADRFSVALSSQRFRDFFEGAIAQVIGDKGRMVIFIDDLDRCEKDVAFRLLESLKLYLNAKNCIYVLGMDQVHLEQSIAGVLSGTEETWRYHPHAHDYLGKMFQCRFLLPVPEKMGDYVDKVLDVDDPFRTLLIDRFSLAKDGWPDLIQKIEENLPHNPRKIKAFISAWKIYVTLLAAHREATVSLDWRLTLILNYLGQFEEPLFRRVEVSPGFYADEIVPFCGNKNRTRPDLLFEGLKAPLRALEAAAETTGALTPPSSAPPISSTGSAESDADRKLPQRDLWIATLVNQVGLVDRDTVRRHLLGAHITP